MWRTLSSILLFAALYFMSTIFIGCSGENPMMPSDEDLTVGETAETSFDVSSMFDKNTVNLDLGLEEMEFSEADEDTTPPPPDKKPDPEPEEVTWSYVLALYR